MVYRGLVLEILSSADSLKMSLVERADNLPTLKTVSEVRLDLAYIKRVCKDIDRLFHQQNSHNLLKQEDIRELKKLGQLLFDELLSKKVKQRLRQLESTDLTLNVDERLVFLPWEILYTGEDFLCLRFNLGRAITTEIDPQTFCLRKFQLPLKMLIVADPTSDLEASYREGLKIKNFLLKYKDIEVDFKSSNVDSLYLKKNLRDYDIFHFAGHYEFNSREPSKSGFLLKDGLLTLDDLHLLSLTQPLPRMVFINACQSATAEVAEFDQNTQHHLYSIAHTFLLGGCQHYIGSSFKLKDELGFEFASLFYREVLNGAGMGDALRQARLGLIKNYGLDNIAWAGYLLYGDPGCQLFNPNIHKKSYISRLPFLKKKRFVIGTASLLLVAVFLGFIFNYLNPHLIYSQALNYLNRGKYESLFELAKRVNKNYSPYPLIYCLLADAYFRLGNSDEALRNYFEYLRLSQKRKDKRGVSSAYLKLAWTYHMNGQYYKAEDFYKKALELSRKNKDKLREADALSRMAVYYVDKKDFEKALSLIIQSSEINLQRKQNRQFRFNLACDYFNLGWIFSQIQQLDKAKEFYHKSKKLFEELGADFELSDYYFNMGEIARFEKRYQDALDLYEKGLALDKKLSHYFNLSSDYQMLAELYWEMGRVSEAERYFYQALELCQRIKNLPVLAEVYYELGIFYKELKDLTKAKEYLTNAETLYREINLPDYNRVREALISLE